ncbi:hypothetical protein D3C78_1977500 [compost metagenome]
MPGAPKEWSKKAGKARFDAALMLLRMERRVREEEYRKPNRHTAVRLVPCEPALVDLLDA